MKIVKIGAIWCGACLVMNKVWNDLQKSNDFEAVELDYDMDEEEVLKYNPGDVLPVFIFYSDNQEVCRMVGEHSYQEMEEKVKEVLG